MIASDAQINFLLSLFDEREVDAGTYHLWGRQVKLHQNPRSPVVMNGWQAGVLIENFLKLPKRNRSYSPRHSR